MPARREPVYHSLIRPVTMKFIWDVKKETFFIAGVPAIIGLPMAMFLQSWLIAIFSTIGSAIAVFVAAYVSGQAGPFVFDRLAHNFRLPRHFAPRDGLRSMNAPHR